MWFVIPLIVKNPLFLLGFAVWFGGLVFILFRKKIFIFLKARLKKK